MTDRVLVTGGSGFLAEWQIVRLLQAGYEMRATLRDLSRAAADERIAGAGKFTWLADAAAVLRQRLGADAAKVPNAASGH